MKRYIGVLAAVFILGLGYGCATKEYVNSRVDPLEARVGKLEKAGTASLDADLKRAEAAAARAEEAAKQAEAAQEKAAAAEKKAETAAQKSAKEFELMQKK